MCGDPAVRRGGPLLRPPEKQGASPQRTVSFKKPETPPQPPGGDGRWDTVLDGACDRVGSEAVRSSEGAEVTGRGQVQGGTRTVRPTCAEDGSRAQAWPRVESKPREPLCLCPSLRSASGRPADWHLGARGRVILKIKAKGTRGGDSKESWGSAMGPRAGRTGAGGEEWPARAPSALPRVSRTRPWPRSWESPSCFGKKRTKKKATDVLSVWSPASHGGSPGRGQPVPALSPSSHL